MICTFFGHKDTPAGVKPLLENAVRELIKDNEEITFYVGTHGRFDGMVQSVLDLLSKECELKYCIVLAYLSNSEYDSKYCKDKPTLYPEGIENTPKWYAISYRNKWMARQTDVVICYITRSFGGAVQFVEMARKRGSEIINLAEQ